MMARAVAAGLIILAVTVGTVLFVTPSSAALTDPSKAVSSDQSAPACVTPAFVADFLAPADRRLAAPATNLVTLGFLRGTFEGPPDFPFDFLEVWTQPGAFLAVFYLNGCAVRQVSR